MRWNDSGSFPKGRIVHSAHVAINDNVFLFIHIPSAIMLLKSARLKDMAGLLLLLPSFSFMDNR